MGEQLGYPYTKPRGIIAAQLSSPGPVYMLPPLVGEVGHDFQSTHSKAPGYSLGKVLSDQKHVRSPGPAAYAQNPKQTHHGDDTGPKYTMAQRLEEHEYGFGPGPAEYVPIMKNVLPRNPEHIMGMRLNEPLRNRNPAPNAYTMPAPDIVSQKPSAPKYTLASRDEYNANTKNPGPADYTVGSPDLVLGAAPKYSIGANLKEFPGNVTPGPAAYKSEDVTLHMRRPPKFTMGILHSPYKGEFDSKYYDDA